MLRRPKPAVASNVIKWTEEEWQAIASRVLEEKGDAILHSPGVEEVKAKDVFRAQNVLPESRHRKLISISQGFQLIRHRLHGIFQAWARVLQHDLFSATPSTSDDKMSGTEPTLTRTSALQSFDGQAAINSVSEASMSGGTPQEAVPTCAGLLDVHEPISADKLRGEGAASIGQQLPQATLPGMHNVVHENAKVTHATRRQPDYRAPSPNDVRDLVELARPFVAMVCQELASALVRAMSEKGGMQGRASTPRAALADAVYSSVRQQDDLSFAGSAINEAPGSQSEAPMQANDASDDDDAHFADDVQPLFDPKLPPSANSSFKPVIALIATSARDFEDLKQFYPQLELNVVALEDLRTAPSLRNCQRMIGLREDVPAPADDFLRKTFRKRYVRIAGGIAEIREQLNAWFNNPGTMNAAAPGWPRKQGNGKGPANGYSKKNPFRRPRPTP